MAKRQIKTRDSMGTVDIAKNCDEPLGVRVGQPIKYRLGFPAGRHKTFRPHLREMLGERRLTKIHKLAKLGHGQFSAAQPA